jgi:hypothetical protein
VKTYADDNETTRFEKCTSQSISTSGTHVCGRPLPLASSRSDKYRFSIISYRRTKPIESIVDYKIVIFWSFISCLLFNFVTNEFRVVASHHIGQDGRKSRESMKKSTELAITTKTVSSFVVYLFSDSSRQTLTKSQL